MTFGDLSPSDRILVRQVYRTARRVYCSTPVASRLFASDVAATLRREGHPEPPTPTSAPLDAPAATQTPLRGR